jgi:hypothetical protein
MIIMLLCHAYQPGLDENDINVAPQTGASLQSAVGAKGSTMGVDNAGQFYLPRAEEDEKLTYF